VGANGLERRLPRRLANVLDDHVDAPAAGCLFDRLDDIAGGVVHDRICAELPRPLELGVARGCPDHARAECLRDHERRRTDPAADTPGEDPLAFLQVGPRDEHPVDGLEDQREGCRFLEGQTVRDRIHVRRRDRDQLGVGAVGVLADDGDPIAVLEAGVDDDPTSRLVQPGAVGAEDPWLRHRGQPSAYPDVEMVHGRSPQLDQDVLGPGFGIGRVLVAEHFRAAVLVNAHRLHRARL
jgi:hypothetical protein